MARRNQNVPVAWNTRTASRKHKSGITDPKRRVLIASIMLAGGLCCNTPVFGGQSETSIGWVWHDVANWGVEGRGWPEEPRLRHYDRLPASAEPETRKIIDLNGKFSVWDMSRCSAGMMARFRTDAREIHVRYTLLREAIALPHMPATGMSGVDLYARDGDGAWRYVSGIKPQSREVHGEIVSGLSPGVREFALYLPLYNGVESLEIGVPTGSRFEGISP